MSALYAGSKSKTLAAMCLFALFSLCLFAAPLARATVPEDGVKYKLRADGSSPGAFEVSLSFKLNKGDKVVLEPPLLDGTSAVGVTSGDVEFRIEPKPEYQVEPVSEHSADLRITANSEVEVEVPYRVSFQAEKPLQSAGEAPRNAKPILPIILSDLQVFKASQVLICPRTADTRSPIANDYKVEFTAGSGQTVLTPWEKPDGGYSFKVSGETALLENYVAIGRMETLEKKYKDCEITVGFTSDHQGLTSEQRKKYVDDLTALFGRISETMGPRSELPRLSILVAGDVRYDLEGPAAEGLFSSVLTFNGAKSLRGTAAAASAGSLFELWNSWVIVPADKGGGLWFQRGIPWFYSYRAAAETGLIGSDQAYSGFSQIYLDYVSDPMPTSASLADTESPSLLAEKGAVLCASVAKRLADQTEGAKDIDWLLGELAREFDHFQGVSYMMVDITELLEGATGKSWDGFFDERLNGTKLIPPSEFSSSGLFGAENNGVGGKEFVVKGSGKSWLILLVAVLFLFMIPLIFSTYVRRSVKLDLSMPRILPEDEEESEQEEKEED
ncbi:MAG: hypothetical protein JJE48_01640 [Actinobacteria bacterium]|nr:hypothetical protein [Actinomycetota bacterium]